MNSEKKFKTEIVFLFHLIIKDTPTKEISTKKPAIDSDIFASFLNASCDGASSNQTINSSLATIAASRTEEEDDFFNQSISSAPNKQKQLTKDSILALYGNCYTSSFRILKHRLMEYVCSYSPFIVRG